MIALKSALRVWTLSDPQIQLRIKVMKLWKLWIDRRDKI